VPGPWADYLWFAIAAWLSDRFLRLARIINCNFRIRFSRSFISLSLAKATYYKQANVIKIDIEVPSARFTPAAGQHYFLYQPASLSGWESHPFTLASYRDSSVTQPGNCRALRDDRNPINNAKSIGGSEPFAVHDKSLTFFVRPYDGWTRRLRDACNSSGDGTATPQLLLEGPYGQRRSLAKFDTILMIVGGTGVATAIPLILEHTERAQHHRIQTTRMQLIWSDRNIDFLTQVCTDSLASSLRLENFDASLFCTSAQTATLTDETADTPGLERPKMLRPYINSPASSANPLRIQYGRPAVSSIVSIAAKEATESKTSCAVVTCGPGSMADDVRAAVYKAMVVGDYNVELFEESFGW